MPGFCKVHFSTYYVLTKTVPWALVLVFLLQDISLSFEVLLCDMETVSSASLFYYIAQNKLTQLL